MNNQPVRFAPAAMLIILLWTISLSVSQPAHDRMDENRVIFETVSSGDAHSCGIMSDGRLVCWGYNGDGRSNVPDGFFAQVSVR